MPNKKIYLVKDLARSAGYTVYTVEHYLKEGLLKESGRSPHTNYRYFNDTSVKRLEHIRELRHQGRSLKEIRKLLE